jgi:hypothetical protein
VSLIGREARAVFDRAASAFLTSSRDDCPASCPCGTGADVPEDTPQTPSLPMKKMEINTA